MSRQTFKDSVKYSFAQCLIWQTTRTLIPDWDFKRLAVYTPLYTDCIQKFVMRSCHLGLYTDYLPTAEVVLHNYKKVLQPIVRYQKTIGYDALELLVFGSFLGFYCARLYVGGIKEAPDYAVIAIANAIAFFDDTDQFEEDGWTRLDACARELLSAPEWVANQMVSDSKMGGRIQQFLWAHAKLPRPAHVANSSKVKQAISFASEADKRSQTPELQKNNQTPYTNGLLIRPQAVYNAIASREPVVSQPPWAVKNMPWPRNISWGYLK